MNTFAKCAPQRAYSGHPLFNAAFPSWADEFFGREFAGHVPAVNITEDEKSWTIEVSAAGYKKEDFGVKLEKEVLTIRAEQKQESSEEKKNYRRREFRTGSFVRSFRIQKDKVNEEGISATYENGILTVTVPKKEAVAPKDEAKEIHIA